MPSGITVFGLGPGDPGLLTREVWELLCVSRVVFLRTLDHPVVTSLPSHLDLRSFDDLYTRSESFEAVYRSIIEHVLAAARGEEGAVYGVPGDPTIGEATVAGLRAKAGQLGLSFGVLHGVSFVEPCLAALELDALDGLSVTDALELATCHHPPFSPDSPALVGQLYSQMVASDVKLCLLNQYPPDHPIRLVHAAGTSLERLEDLPLHDLDRNRNIGSLTALYVPPLSQPSGFESFQEIVAHLRAPEGCPWDREQTHQSLRTHLMEEAYEALQALDHDDSHDLREELGDLMLQIVLQAQIATEYGEFNMADVLSSIRAKLIRRRPHVFGGLEVAGVDEVLHNWEALKAAEREADGGERGALDGIPAGLPALAQAAETQSRGAGGRRGGARGGAGAAERQSGVARLGFDWPEIEGVTAKVFEELDETLNASVKETRSAETGHLLFSVVNYARWRNIDPEAALRQANERFRRRFSHLEAVARISGKSVNEMKLDEMDSLWEAAKDAEA